TPAVSYDLATAGHAQLAAGAAEVAARSWSAHRATRAVGCCMADRIEQLIALGREHYNAGELERAEPFLAEAAAARPRFPDIYNMLAVIYHSQGRFQDAAAAFETALRRNPRSTEPALTLSATCTARGKYDRAREVYARAVSASAGQPHALDQFARGKLANMHADLGAAYAGLALFDEAVREYAKALELCPD